MKKDKWDEYDVREASRTLQKAQAIPKDPRKGFYAAVKKQLALDVAAAKKTAMEAEVAAAMHKVFPKEGK